MILSKKSEIWSPFAVCASFFLAILWFVLPLPTAGAEEEQDLSNEACLSCHSDPDLTKKGPDGKTVSLFIDEKRFQKSAHGANECISCHADISEIPHPETLEKVQCGNCHSDESDTYLKSTHGKAFLNKIPEAPGCATCHGKHDILPPSDFASKTHPLHQIEICTSCHMNPRIAGKYNLPPRDKIEAYKSSTHGRGVIRSGLLVSATCVDCHSAHNVRHKGDPESTIYWSKIPDLCGTCHLGILEDFKLSEHGILWARKSPSGPGCVTCHGAHGIQEPTTTEFQMHIPLICARCHEKKAPTYQDTFHGEAVSLGFIRAATCSDCHTPHRNLPASNPASTVSKTRLRETCGKCHTGASDSFVTYDPHVDPHDREANPLVYYVYKAMVLLLFSVFGFYSFHTVFWLQRSIVGYFRGEFEKFRNGQEPWVKRFNLTARIIHIFIMISFLGLAFTGLPLHFHYAAWPVTLVNLLGGLEVFRFFHRFFAIITFGYVTYHAGYLIVRIVRKKERGLLYGPLSMVPRPKDFIDLYHQVRWFFYLGNPAKLDRWTYWEKFDYFAVFWGVPVIGLSGLMLWFPGFFTSFLPGYVLNVAKVIHSEEALLAVGFIFVFHFFHTHLRPESFPMDLVIFTGRIPLERFRKERPEEYARLQEKGELEQFLVPPPSPGMRRFGYIAGAIGLSIGIALVVAIVLSVILYA